jgi:uncharacterized protein (DUF1015 family)
MARPYARITPRPTETKANVPQLFPFRGTRYAGISDVTAVSAPPYDVIDDDELAALEQLDPHNAVRLILPRDTDRLDRYSAAAETLRAWLDADILKVDESEHLYAYRMTYADSAGRARQTLGVIGALELPPTATYADVLPHERTLPKARSDRLSLLRATRANFDPIWVLSLSPGLTDAIGAPHATATAGDAKGTLHEVAPLDASAAAAVMQQMTSAATVLADGHHRFETACTYRDEHPENPGANRIMALAVELAEDQLWVQAIHRIIEGAPDLRSRLPPDVGVEAVGEVTPETVAALVARIEEEHALGLVDGKGLALLRPDRGSLDAALVDVPTPLHGVGSVTFDALIRPRLGEATLSYRADAATVAALVNKDPAKSAVLLPPVSVPQIRAVAQAGERMPEKTTFFAPKPRTGMVMRSL